MSFPFIGVLGLVLILGIAWAFSVVLGDSLATFMTTTIAGLLNP